MKVVYRINGMDAKTKNQLCADLVGYRIQRDLDAENKMRKLADNKTWVGRILEATKNSGSSTGMTVDTIIQGLNTALSMDIFSFKINGIDIFKDLQERMKTEPLELEINMNDLYFSSEIALKQAISPGFRKNVTTEYITERMARAKQSWLFQWEKQVREYFDASKSEKKIIEG